MKLTIPVILYKLGNAIEDYSVAVHTLRKETTLIIHQGL